MLRKTFVVTLWLALAPAAGIAAEENPLAELSLKQLVERLDGDDLQARNAAVAELGRRGEVGKETVDDLAARLGPDAPPGTRIAAAAALGNIGPRAKGAVPEIIKQLGAIDSSREETMVLRWTLVFALMGIGPDAAAGADLVIARLDDSDFQVRCIACRALGAIGKPAAMKSVAPLCKTLEEDTAPVRRRAAEALGNIGEAGARESLAQLRRSLSDRNQIVREEAVVALGKIGPPAKAAADDIRPLVSDPEFGARPHAAWALWRIEGDTPAATAALVGMLDDLDHSIMAAAFLGEMGAAAKGAVPALVARLDGPDEELRPIAAMALGYIGPAAKEAIPALEKMQENENEEGRAAAAEALKKIKS